MTVTIDSSCFKITERGDWLSSKWNGKRKGWIKMHIAIDAERMNVVSLTITDKLHQDPKEFGNVLLPTIGKASSVYGDKGYGSIDNFNYLHDEEVKAVTLPRKNTRILSLGSPTRAKVVRKISYMGMEEWKGSVHYGKRWMVEIFFSALKRTMVEAVTVKKLAYLIHEAVMKIYAYFILRRNTVVN